MKRDVVLIALAAIVATGCSDSYNGNRSTGAPPAAQLDFNTFVIAQYSSTNETARPLEVDQTNFGFSDQDNPAAFSSVLAAAP